ncbi:Leucine carboxyl methyltransferase 1 [Candida viswanathii]|uniref:Leucine carboxyl methyltransferase 1 n=1 Tax=Candida viswanathii TaxID=5486 RepID=A0A367YCJ0_9ASCO|nr:Leucine carboxyl methyltransferase 1 [Candida viswanathii]
MFSPQDRHDKLVRATDLDALSCRYSIDEKQYLCPPDEYIQDVVQSYQQHLQFCQGYTQLSASRTLRSVFQERKFPLINRGSYLRTTAIDKVVQQFIKEFDGKCQIVSLGSGSDTRAFPLLEQHPDLVVHEIDFPESTRIKKLAILQNHKLRGIVETDDPPPTIDSKSSFSEYSPDMHTPRYFLHGLDLRTLAGVFPLQDLPTLVISECVLCYLPPEEYEQTIKYWTSQARSNIMGFLIYEPMSLDDQFGSTMTQNLLNRGLNLQMFSKYPDLPARKRFLELCGLLRLRLTDMSDVGGYKGQSKWIDDNELQRINKLELIDEIEEIRLLLDHYCLVYGEYSGTFTGIDTWDWIL